MRRQRQLLIDTIFLGLIGGLSAQVFAFLLRLFQDLFLKAIAGYQMPDLVANLGVSKQVIGPHGLWLIPVVTTLGGLISGLLVYSLAPEAEGHGTDTVVKAYHQAGGYLRARVPGLKMLASAITIGSGGSAGREGPTALISAGIGSVYASLMKRPEDERRLLTLIGMASGLSAIFRSPIGTAFFAIEVLYANMEFDAGALLYTMIGSVVAYVVNGWFVGWRPLFQMPPNLSVSSVTDFGWYILLGLVSGVVAAILPNVFYLLRDAFHALPGPPHIKPAIGGLLLGLLAMSLPQVLGGGYGWIQMAIDGNLAIGLVLALVFAKMIAFGFTVSSGGSGGVFAPSLYVGAMVGSALALLFGKQPAAFAVVGMAAVFGGAARVPIATLLMVSEMTGGYGLLGPAALAVMLSYLVQVSLTTRMKYKSLYEAQVPGRADSPAHHLEQVENVIHLLASRGIILPNTISHLDLRTLVASGIPIELPDNKQLRIGIIGPKSPLIGKTIAELVPKSEENKQEIVAIFRDGHTIIPHPNVRVKLDDRILMIVGSHYWEEIEHSLTPLTPITVIKKSP
jgi:CIC family chloride channel protein